MIHKPHLSESYIKDMLAARFNAEYDTNVRIQQLIRQAIGAKAEDKPDPEKDRIQQKLVDYLSDVLARRLSQERIAEPLFAPVDMDEFISTLVDELDHSGDLPLNAAERAKTQQFLASIVQGIFTFYGQSVPDGKDPYEEYWRWISMLVDLAVERDSSPIVLIAEQNGQDEIIPRERNI